MTLLIFGETGQVARELARLAPDAQTLDRTQADFTDPDRCVAAIARYAPRAIIIAAAYTAVDRAETDPDLAQIVNATTPGVIAHAAAAQGIPLLHLSSDYVFDGHGSAPFAPQDETAPLGVYGRTKRDGEVAVRAADGPHIILRTSWVVSAHGTNFVKTMLRLGAARDTLSVVADQISGPTAAHDIATACLHMLDALCADKTLSGTYHFSGTPDVSWADFARAILQRAALPCTVLDIATSGYPTPAPRLVNSRRDCATTLRRFGIVRPDWRTGLDTILHDLKPETPPQ